MSTASISYEELEGLHDVLEAARCYWHAQPSAHDRAAPVLQLVNKLYWRLGEQLPKTGRPSARFNGVVHSSAGDTVERLLEVVDELTRQYSNAYDPWWADTVVASPDVVALLNPRDQALFENSLRRLGLTLEVQNDCLLDSIAVERRDQGPWQD